MMRRPFVLSCAAMVILLSGCASTAPVQPASTHDATTSGPEARAAEAAPVLLVDRDFSLAPGRIEFGNCASPDTMQRVPGALVTPGHGALEFDVDATSLNTGIEVGYAFDHGPTTWLPVVFHDHQRFAVKIGANQTENDTASWRFLFSQDVKGAQQGCYVGVDLESHVIVRALAATP